MGLRTRKAWASTLLAVAVMTLAPGRAVADELDPGELKSILEGRTTTRVIDPGELKARMESFSVAGVGSQDALDPGEYKAIVEAPARYGVVEPGELKALTEARAWPSQAAVRSGGSDRSGADVGAATIALLVLLLAAGGGIVFARWRDDRIAPV